MAVNYTTLQVQFGALLRISQKIETRQIHARDADNANYDRRLLVVANGFSTSDNEEATALAGLTSYLDDSEVEELKSRFSGWRSQVESQVDGLGLILGQDLDATPADKASAFIDYEYDEALADGTIAIVKRTGLLGALRRDMELNGQYVVACVVAFGALTAAAGNQGTLTATSATGESHCLGGTLTIECVDDTVDAPKFALSMELTKPLADGTKDIEADNQLTAEKSFQDGPTGITTLLTRPGLAAPTELTDVGACFSATSFSAPSGTDSNMGIFYVRTTRQASGPTWLIEFFADAAYTQKRGYKTSDTVLGNDTFTVILTGGTQITTTFSRVAANVQMPAAGNSAGASWDIDTPRKGDKWTRAITNDEAGLFSTKIGRAWRGSLPVSGASQWTDANAATVAM